MWEVLTGDIPLFRSVLNHLMEVLTLSLPYQERTRTSAGGVVSYQRVETPIPKNVSNIGVCRISNTMADSHYN